MKTALRAVFLIPAMIAMVAPVVADEPSIVWREDFEDMDSWEELTFPGIDRHTEYSIVELGDGRTVLKAVADRSASGLVHEREFDPFEKPILRWRWRVENVLEDGDAARKSGDDYPMRVYVLFKYDPDRAGWRMRARYALARRIHGKYPPHASVNYIWANREHDRRILPSAYTDRSMMVILRAGTHEVGLWVEEQVNILEDYREAFDEEPPREASVAVMTDADDTGGEATGYLDFIELRTTRKEKSGD